MFSSRFHWDARPNRITELIENKRRSGAKLLDLTESNPTRAGFKYSPEILRAFADPGILSYDPQPAGALATRQAVSEYYAARGCQVLPERILLTASTSEAYSYLFKLLADPGDEVLVPQPSYPLFEFLARMEKVEPRQYPLRYDTRWWIDLGAMEHAIIPRTKAIVLVNPNNPTGSYVKRSELDALVRLSTERRIPLIADEVFSDFAFGADRERASTLAGVEDCLAFSMSGLSKVAGLPQMKLGWIVASGPPALRDEALHKLEWIADTYLSVSTPVQCAAKRLLDAGEDIARQMRERTAANLESARAALQATPARILNVEGGWYGIVQVPRVRTEEEWVLDLLERCNALVHPGFFYDFEAEAYLVLSLLTDENVFREGVKRISAVISEL